MGLGEKVIMHKPNHRISQYSGLSAAAASLPSPFRALRLLPILSGVPPVGTLGFCCPWGLNASISFLVSTSFHLIIISDQ